MSLQYIKDVLEKDLVYLQAVYKKKDGTPKIKDERSLKQLRRIYKERNMEPMTTEPERRLTKEWEVSGLVDGEWTTTVNRAWSHENTLQDFQPATPAKITPSRKKPVARDHKTLFVFSDAQIDYRRIGEELVPIHDERAIKVAQLICRDLQPDEIINLGDTVDLSSFSRFKPDSDHFQRTLGPSFQRVHDMYAQFRADSPRARIIEVDSNHNTRLKDFMLKNAPQLYGVKRPGEEDYPVFTYPYLANLGHLGVEWISGYGAAEYVYDCGDNPPIVFKHGMMVASNASTAARESKENAETHVVRGHGHRVEQHTRTNRAGEYLVSLQIGALCKTTGEVPSYHSAVDDNGRVVKHQENQQNSVLVIKDYDGYLDFHNIYIREGVAIYDGRLYVAE